jgi:putative membrane protein
MELIIPEDFSEKVASADTTHPQQAHFELIGNQSANSIATTMGTSAFRVITSKVNYAIGQDYYVTIFDTIDDSAASIKGAADGSATLADGLVDAQDGSQRITDNLLTAGTGADELAAGLVSAAQGSQKLASGVRRRYWCSYAG